ncbi:MAG: proline--tRNA ligase [Nitrospirota bacterium]
MARYSNLLIPTLREDPGEAETVSHRLLLRAGMIRKLAAGIYNFLPLGYRVLKRVERIVREEMDRAGAQEILMPFVQPAELWEETGRWAQYGKELARLKDRHDRNFCLGPTHEEVVTDLVRREVKSYRQLPVTLYQIQSKFRDEIRPRFGLMRGREFLMKDAYSFDRDDAGSEKSYEIMYRAYARIFERCGLTFRAVEADAGLIGGNFSHEFMVLAETGEDAIAACDRCGYGANVERAEAKAPAAESGSRADVPPAEEVSTPRQHTVAEVAERLGVPAARLIKTMLYQADDDVVAVLIRGDHEANEVKLKRYLKVDHVALASDGAITRVTGGPKGFSGPVGLKDVKIIADHAAAAVSDVVVGANKAGTHLTHVEPFRDFQINAIADLRNVVTGDPCPRCADGHLTVSRGIEVGHVFRLGTKYTEKMKAVFLDQDGKEQTIIMGCYGIGVSRIMAAAVEQNHDAKGIIWPAPLSPYAAHVIPLSDKPAVVDATARIEAELTKAGVEVLIDDRSERPGVKFNDADLLGISLHVVLGDKSLAQGEVEFKERRTGNVRKIKLDDAAGAIIAWVNASQ